MAALDSLHEAYEKRWRQFLLLTNPLGILAFGLCLILEVPSQQALLFDQIAYACGTLLSLILQLMLFFKPQSLRFVIASFVFGLSVFFLVRLSYLMTMLNEGIDIPAQLSEGFYWIPVIYLLALALPRSLFNKRMQGFFAVSLIAISIIFISLASYTRKWDAVYALSQVALANLAIFLLLRGFTHYKDALITTQVKLNLTEHFAYTDSVTGLPNRLQLESYLRERIAQAQVEAREFFVLFIDFDNFKLINDVLGHEAGDTVLKQTSQRMQQVLGKEHFLARQSGDEFVVVTASNLDASSLQTLAKSLREAVYSPLKIADSNAQLSASIGISHFPTGATSAEGLLRQADAAMYRIKKSGKNGAVFFESDIDDISAQKHIEQDIRYALERNEIFLVAQPMINLHSGKVVRFEILARWKHPRLGLISPAQFIPAAEHSGFIVTLGEWVLRQACQEALEWSKSYPELKLSVNVSRLQLAHPDFIKKVTTILDDTAIDRQNLDLEMTESVLEYDKFQTHKILEQLRELGLGLMVDDFGQGYSSLAYLKDFPFDVIKLDKTFIQDLQNPQSEAYSRAILLGVNEIAKHLKLDLVAEGIETAEQVHICRELGYNVGQGFYFSKPIAINQVLSFMQDVQPNQKRAFFQENPGKSLVKPA